MAAWWEEQSLRFYLDWHVPDHDQLPPGTPRIGAALDVEALADVAASCGVRAMVFPAKDNQGNVLWPSRLGHLHSDFVGRDVVGEFVAALHAREIKAVAYFQPIRDKRAFDEHPAWRQIYNDGTERVEQGRLQSGAGGHRCVCPLGEAGAAMLALLEELLAMYDLDGIWWDRVGDIRGSRARYPCFCAACSTAYEGERGTPIPRDADWSSPAWRAYWQWRSDRLIDFQARARDLVGRIRPGAGLLSNEAFLGMALVDPMPVSIDMERGVAATDVAVIEYQHFRTYLSMSLNPRLIAALADRPVDVMAWNAYSAGDGVVRSTLASEVALATFVGLGHSATFQDTVDFHGSLDPRTESMALGLLERAGRHLELVAGTAPVRHTAVLYSPETALWHRDGDNDLYHREIAGLARQVIGAHVPFEIVSDRHLTPEGLEGLSVLVLADAGRLDVAAVDAVSRWVRAGGVVLASGDAAGPAAALLGIREVEPSPDPATWMRACTGISGGLGWVGPIALRAPTVLATPTPDVEILAELATLLPGFDLFAHYMHQVRSWGPYPAVMRRRIGDGSAIYVAGLLGAADLQWGMHELSAPLRAALACASEPLVRADAPACVELLARSTQDRLVVTLTNLQGDIGRTHRMTTLGTTTQGVNEILPVHDVKLTVGRPVVQAGERLHGAKVSFYNQTVVLHRLDASAVVEIMLG